MWAVPTFVAMTWWSWRTVRLRSTGVSARLVAWWLIGAFATLGALAFATRRLAESSWDAPEWLLWGAVGGVLAVLLAIDVDVQLLPREVSLPAFVVAVVFLSIVEGPADIGRWGPLVGALVMTAITWALRLVSRGSLGMGDVLVSPLLGSVLGWFDPWAVVAAWVVAALAGGVGAAISLIRVEPRQSLVAYGPFLILGTAAALVMAAI
jgi:leader peptidase (prepilin peptidase)/N-methyltransferase